MSTPAPLELTPLFEAVRRALEEQRAALNQSDQENGDHGDHMVEIFAVASQAAQAKAGAPLAEIMRYAGERLGELRHNGSAQMYAHGLTQFARNLSSRQVSLAELVSYGKSVLQEKNEENRATQAGAEKLGAARSGEVLKALTGGLYDWQQVEDGQEPNGKGVDVGYLFELGMAYLQAKQRGGGRAQILAEAAATASPLSRVGYRKESGRMAIQAFLEAMGAWDGQ